MRRQAIMAWEAVVVAEEVKALLMKSVCEYSAGAAEAATLPARLMTQAVAVRRVDLVRRGLREIVKGRPRGPRARKSRW